MAIIPSKLRKFVRNPNLFMRDFFLKRVPLELSADINRVTSADDKRLAGQSSKKSRSANVTTILDGYINFSRPIDAVITWVDGADPEFVARKEKYKQHDTSGHVAANSVARYQNSDEVRYCIRSIQQFAPWIRNIYLVTNGQIPQWFNPDQNKVKIVTHDDIIPAEYLPTFNSHVIESCLHRIEGISEHYVYFNDDVMLLRPVKANDFFTETGLMRGFVSSAVIPNGPPISNDTPSMTAIKNARKLLFDRTGFFLSPKFAHTYHPQRRSVALACEQEFREEFHICRMNKFRNSTDLLCTSFLFPCYAYISGNGVFSRLRAWYFNIRDVSAKSLYVKLLGLKDNSSGPLSVCLNDHLPDTLKYNFEEYEQALTSFLNTYFDKPTQCERDAHHSDTTDVQLEMVHSKS